MIKKLFVVAVPCANNCPCERARSRACLSASRVLRVQRVVFFTTSRQDSFDELLKVDLASSVRTPSRVNKGKTSKKNNIPSRPQPDGLQT